ncbi:MAG TPA: diguanylate cyclase [Actinomycetota bacterium]|mgnify:CR=1 FL=1|nr:diguanylate cyclase [Actinomycetota bacterium]
MAESEAPTEPIDPVVVMVIDDDPNANLLIGDLLAEPDRELVFAASGTEALRLLRKTTPAAILLDVNLGDMTGFELAGLVRANPRLATTPILFVTGYAFNDDAMSAGYDLGAVDYLSKPVVPQILQSKVNVFCTLAQQLKQIERQRDRLRAIEQQLSEANANLQLLAATDPLTSLMNRRQLMNSLAAVRAHQQRSGRHHGVAVIDLDGFKTINDTLGHAAGDEVLVLAAGRLRGIARPYDLVARLGGDEFCVVVQEIQDDDDLASMGERIHGALAADYQLSDGRFVAAPGSVGLALHLASHNVTIDQILAAADRAMYEAKKAGSGLVISGAEESGEGRQS